MSQNKSYELKHMVHLIQHLASNHGCHEIFQREEEEMPPSSRTRSSWTSCMCTAKCRLEYFHSDMVAVDVYVSYKHMQTCLLPPAEPLTSELPQDLNEALTQATHQAFTDLELQGWSCRWLTKTPSKYKILFSVMRAGRLLRLSLEWEPRRQFQARCSLLLMYR